MCIWHVARGGLDSWGKNQGDEGGQPPMEQDKPIVQNEPNLPGGAGGMGRGCCTNKANFRHGKKKGKCLAGKELW